MSIVNVTNVDVLDNPTAFKSPLTFQVTFECLEALDAGERADGCALTIFRPSFSSSFENFTRF